MKKGFTLIELLIAIGLAALFLPALVYVFSFSLGAASQGENYTKAYAIAQENMEAVYYLKENGGAEWDWDTTPVYTDPGEYYQPSKIGSSWTLGSKNQPLKVIDGYTTTVEIEKVYRNGDDEIDETASDRDDSSRKVTVNVSWKENGELTNIDLVSYVTKH